MLQDDRYFLSGSLDGKLRLWNIPDKKVALWNELDGQAKLITAANFCQVRTTVLGCGPGGTQGGGGGGGCSSLSGFGGTAWWGHGEVNGTGERTRRDGDRSRPGPYRIT